MRLIAVAAIALLACCSEPAAPPAVQDAPLVAPPSAPPDDAAVDEATEGPFQPRPMRRVRSPAISAIRATRSPA